MNRSTLFDILEAMRQHGLKHPVCAQWADQIDAWADEAERQLAAAHARVTKLGFEIFALEEEIEQLTEARDAAADELAAMTKSRDEVANWAAAEERELYNATTRIRQLTDAVLKQEAEIDRLTREDEGIPWEGDHYQDMDYDGPIPDWKPTPQDNIMLALITEEQEKFVTEHDSDGAYQRKMKCGTITYTCCGTKKLDAHTFMGDGDGDRCPQCGKLVFYSRSYAEV